MIYSKGPVIELELNCDQGFTKAPHQKKKKVCSPLQANCVD